jgi:hypothetical protein
MLEELKSRVLRKILGYYITRNFFFMFSYTDTAETSPMDSGDVNLWLPTPACSCIPLQPPQLPACEPKILFIEIVGIYIASLQKYSKGTPVP